MTFSPLQCMSSAQGWCQFQDPPTPWRSPQRLPASCVHRSRGSSIPPFHGRYQVFLQQFRITGQKSRRLEADQGQKGAKERQDIRTIGQRNVMPNIHTVPDHTTLLPEHAGLDDGRELHRMDVLDAKVCHDTSSQAIHGRRQNEVGTYVPWNNQN